MEKWIIMFIRRGADCRHAGLICRCMARAVSGQPILPADLARPTGTNAAVIRVAAPAAQYDVPQRSSTSHGPPAPTADIYRTRFYRGVRDPRGTAADFPSLDILPALPPPALPPPLPLYHHRRHRRRRHATADLPATASGLIPLLSRAQRVCREPGSVSGAARLPPGQLWLGAH